MAELSEKEGLCSVHLWTGDGFGHISLQAYGGPYISFWPTIGAKGFASVPGKWFSSLNEEIIKKGAPDETFYATNMNIDKITKWWNEFTDNDPEWSLLTKSCSNIVYKALGKGSDRFKGRVEGFATTPKAVAELVKYDMDGKKAKIRLASSCKPCGKTYKQTNKYFIDYMAISILPTCIFHNINISCERYFQ